MTPELKRILYVEDDQDIAEVTQMTLAEFGNFEVQYCSSGQEALAALPVHNPQLVLMDVMMPGMDGPTTFKHVRTMAGYEALPVVFMTAKAQTHEQAAYRDMGVAGVIVKPFDPMLLCQNILDIWAHIHV